MLKHLKRLAIILASITLGSLVFVWLIGKAGIKEVVATFIGISVYWVGFFLLVSFLLDIVLAWRWQTILKYHGHKLPFWTCFRYRLMGYAVSYITPSAHVGGEPVRAMMLRKHNIPTADAFSSVILDKTLEITADIFFGAIGMLMVLISFRVPSATYGLMFVAFIITVVLVVKFFKKLKNEERMFVALATKLGLMRFKFSQRVVKKLDEIEASMSSFMSSSLRGFIYALLMSGLLWSLMFFEYWIALKMIGYNANIVEIFLVGVFIGISYIIPVPGALGVLEGGQVSLFQLLGKGASIGIVFGLVIRGRDMLKTLLGLWLLSHSGVNFLNLFFSKNKNGNQTE